MSIGNRYKMHLKFNIGMIIIYSLLLSTLLKADDDLDDDDDDYSYVDDDTTTTITPKFITTKRKTTTTEQYFPDLDDIARFDMTQCPIFCQCSSDGAYVNCINRNLTTIPLGLPEYLEILDLSSNLIEEINNDAFKNSQNIKEIHMSNNRIRNLAVNTFKYTLNLRKLVLSQNYISDIPVDIFSKLNKLKILELNNNPISIPSDTQLLNAENLVELSLGECNISNVYDKTFKTLNGLLILNLNNNTFDENTINIKSFEPLQNLQSLKITDISESNIGKICNKLQTIDTIQTRNYLISCFELTSGLDFEASKIKATTTTTTQKTIIEIVTKSKTYLNNKDSSSPPRRMRTTTVKPLLNKYEGLNSTDTSLNQTSSEISENTSHTYLSMNNILIGIIIISLVGLIIGGICRKDVCGIKTKLCRTKRRAPSTTENSSPAEEVPLNKV